MGLVKELFVNADNIDEEFICTICQEVLHNPVMTLPCEHVYCKSCIELWHETAINCPMDRQPVTTVRQPQRPFLNMYRKLQVKCKFYIHGCSFNLELGDAEIHHVSCMFNPDLALPCPSNCGAMVRKADLETHDCIKYLKGVNTDLRRNMERLTTEKETLVEKHKSETRSSEAVETFLNDNIQRQINEIKTLKEEKGKLVEKYEAIKIDLGNEKSSKNIAITHHLELIKYWEEKYISELKKNEVPSPIQNLQSNNNVKKSKVFFDVAVDGNSMGRIIIEIRPDILPKTCELFLVLCSGEKGFGYKNSTLSRATEADSFLIVPSPSDRQKMKSSYGSSFSFENHNLKHNGVGSVSLVKIRNSNFAFCIGTTEGASTNPDYAFVIGSVIDGMKLIEEMNGFYANSGKTRTTRSTKIRQNITVIDCGSLN